MESQARHSATRSRTSPELEYLRQQALGSAAVSSAQPAAVSPATLAKASRAWMGGTFLLCYAVLPMVLAMSGVLVYGGLFLGSMAGWMLGGLLLSRWIQRVKPEVRVGEGQSPDAHAVGAAFLGHFGVWAVLHTLLPGLLPLYLFGLGGLAIFAAVNVLESLMVAAMLGTLAQSPGRAFAFGAGLQTLVMLTAVLVGA